MGPPWGVEYFLGEDGAGLDGGFAYLRGGGRWDGLDGASLIFARSEGGWGGLRYAVLLDSALLHLAHGLSPYEKK